VRPGGLTEQASIVAEFIRKLGLERRCCWALARSALALGVALDHPELRSVLALSPAHASSETCAGAVPGAGTSNQLFALACCLDCGPRPIAFAAAINPRAIFSPDPRRRTFRLELAGSSACAAELFNNTSSDMRAVNYYFGAFASRHTFAPAAGTILYGTVMKC